MKPYTPEKLPISNLSWDKFISKIGEANRNLARYDGTLSAMINPGLLLSPLTTQEAVLSSRIEGTQGTLKNGQNIMKDCKILKKSFLTGEQGITNQGHNVLSRS